MEILVIGSPNGNTANLLAPNNCCKVRTERMCGRCSWRISSRLHVAEGILKAYLSNFRFTTLNLKWGEKNIIVNYIVRPVQLSVVLIQCTTLQKCWITAN